RRYGVALGQVLQHDAAVLDEPAGRLRSAAGCSARAAAPHPSAARGIAGGAKIVLRNSRAGAGFNLLRDGLSPGCPMRWDAMPRAGAAHTPVRGKLFRGSGT